MPQTLRITVGSEDTLYFEEVIWEADEPASTLRFGDIEDTEMMLGLLSLRIQGFVEGAAIHADGTEDAKRKGCKEDTPRKRD